MDRQAAKKVADSRPQPPWGPWAGLACRAALGLLLIYTGLLKASGPSEEFAVVIHSYYIISSTDLINAAAVFLPWAEIILGFSILLGFMTRWSARGAGGLLAVFVFALISVKVRGIELPNCGCFGEGLHLSPIQAMIMDLLLIGAAFISSRFGHLKLSLDRWAQAGTP